MFLWRSRLTDGVLIRATDLRQLELNIGDKALIAQDLSYADES